MTRAQLRRLVAALAVLLSPGALLAQDAVVLQRGLDKAVAVNVTNTPIGDVFKKLTDQTGVKFVIPQRTFDALPYAEQTPMIVEFKDVTLRKVLTPLLAPQALQWQIEGDAVVILPKEGLARMCHRATFEEMQILGKLYSVTLKPLAEAGTPLEQLQKITGNKDIKIVFNLFGVETDTEHQAAFARANKALPGTGSDWLDMLGHGQAWTWFLRGNEIVIIDLKTQVERQLQTPVTLKYANAAMLDVLLDLAKKSRVKLVMEPGVLDLLPSVTRENFSLTMNATVAQAFEVISGATGLQFIRTNEGVRVEASPALLAKSTTTAPAAQRPRRAFFVRMIAKGPDGTEMEVFISPDELPDDLVQSILAQKAEFLKKLGAELPKTPATQPAPATPAVPSPTTKPRDPDSEG